MEPAPGMESATNAIQFVAGQAEKYFGGPVGQAYGMFLSGQPGIMGSLADAFDKYESGTLTGVDIADVLYDAAALTAGFGVLTGLAAPWVLTAVGVAGLGLFLYKIYPLAMELAEEAIAQSSIFKSSIDDSVNELWQTTKNFVERLDPLALDLDNDGIEITPANAGIMFDFNSDGIKTGTGWIRGDDGFLVLDRNRDGIINSGKELFGVDTIKSNGLTARDGFDALKDFDENLDGFFDSRDGQFQNIKIWQDHNQDGISQLHELKSLADYNITSISLTHQKADLMLGDSRISATGSFKYSDGSAGELNDNQSLVANLDLVATPFYREFTDRIEVSKLATTLPDMGGAGAVRDLREAATINPKLLYKLQEYSEASSATIQLSLLDDLISEWANSAVYTSFYDRVESLGTAFYAVEFNRDGANSISQEKSTLEKVAILEIFNASNLIYLNFGQPVSGASHTSLTVKIGNLTNTSNHRMPSLTDAGVGKLSISEQDIVFSVDQVSLISSSYEALKNSIYRELLLQTRLKTYAEKMKVTVSDDHVSIDLSQILIDLNSKFSISPTGTILAIFNDWRDLNLTALGPVMEPLLLSAVNDMLSQLSPAEVSATLSALSYALAGTSLNEIISTSPTKSIIFGGGGDDSISGGREHNVLVGGAGADLIDAGAGDDKLLGGTGNDKLNGGTGSDTYLFSLGDGQDTISDNGSIYVTEIDVLRFSAGINVADISVSRAGSSLVLKHVNEVDQVTVLNQFSQDSDRLQLERFEFFDGTTWTSRQLTTLLLTQVGTAGNDVLTGMTGNFNQVFRGDAGNDTLTGGSGNDTLEGGTGNDRLNGGTGSDTYLFSLGDGQDTISDNGSIYSGEMDVLRFSAGISAADISVSRAGNSLTLNHNNGHDKVTILDWFLVSGVRFKIEQIEFSDADALTSIEVERLIDIQLAGIMST